MFTHMMRIPQILTLVLLMSVTLTAQQKSDIEIRLVAERLPKDLGKVVIVSGEDHSPPFALPMNNLSQPQMVPSRVFQLVSLERKLVLSNVRLPKTGKSFVVILIPSSEKNYSSIVVPYNNPKFKAGDVFFYNKAKDTVVGRVGANKFSVTPGKSIYFRPEIQDDGKRYHDVGIGVKFETGSRVISTTRWPKSNNTRYYVFFYVNPKNDRITYRAVDEFLEPPANDVAP